MYELIKVELYKIYKSRIHLPVAIFFIIFLGLSMVMSWYEPGLNKNYLRYTHYIFSINGQLIFPLIVSMFFGPLITKEFKDKTIENLLSSRFSIEQIILGKFFAGTIFFTILYLILITIYQIITILFFADLSIIEVTYTTISFGLALYRVYVISISYLIYSLAFGALTYLGGILTRNQFITLLLPIAVILFYMFIPHYDWMRNLLFFEVSDIYQLLGEDDFPIYRILYSITLCAITMLFFLLLSVLFIEKKEKYIN
ncbi:ABC transporter permease [Niallia sp. HCP3S3_B10]|uniref:ABC transporter permease n=1 Tax=unclassified Niallia TaxID=2837522 RepID=UPI00203DD11E|nr:ABC transporter permease [Niallia sp. MER TA 168]MCM3362016.1 ABC transporter permease [Niallia sp. MER TA 168]